MIIRINTHGFFNKTIKVSNPTIETVEAALVEAGFYASKPQIKKLVAGEKAVIEWDRFGRSPVSIAWDYTGEQKAFNKNRRTIQIKRIVEDMKNEMIKNIISGNIPANVAEVTNRLKAVNEKHNLGVSF